MSGGELDFDQFKQDLAKRPEKWTIDSFSEALDYLDICCEFLDPGEYFKECLKISGLSEFEFKQKQEDLKEILNITREWEPSVLEQKTMNLAGVVNLTAEQIKMARAVREADLMLRAFHPEIYEILLTMDFPRCPREGVGEVDELEAGDKRDLKNSHLFFIREKSTEFRESSAVFAASFP